MKTKELINQLHSLIEGKVWMSEGDYPFSVICWENVDTIKEKLLNGRDNKQIEVKELDDFFGRVTVMEDWYNQEEKEECKSYQELVELLKTNLSDVNVYRIGEVEIDCYILGKTENNTVVGLSTVSVET